jgi:hypothetical protein
VHLDGFLFIVVIADARNHEPKIYSLFVNIEQNGDESPKDKKKFSFSNRPDKL